MLPRYDRLREVVRQESDFGFSTDIPPSRAANHRLQIVQWAAAPATLIHDFELGSVVERLGRGWVLVCDYQDAAALNARRLQFEGWAQAAEVPYDVVVIDDTLAVFRTDGRSRAGR